MEQRKATSNITKLMESSGLLFNRLLRLLMRTVWLGCPCSETKQSAFNSLPPLIHSFTHFHPQPPSTAHTAHTAQNTQKRKKSNIKTSVYRLVSRSNTRIVQTKPNQTNPKKIKSQPRGHATHTHIIIKPDQIRGWLRAVGSSAIRPYPSIWNLSRFKKARQIKPSQTSPVR